MFQQMKAARHIRRLGDKDPEVVSKSARKLGEIGHASAVEPLIGLLQHHHPGVRDATAGALGDIGDPRSFEPLCEMVQSYDPKHYPRASAARALGKLCEAGAVEPLISAMEDNDATVQSGVAEALGLLQDTRAVPVLIRALHEGNEFVRRNAAEALGSIGDVRTMEPLVDALSIEPNNTTRSIITSALLKLGWTPPELVMVNEFRNLMLKFHTAAMGIIPFDLHEEIAEDRATELIGELAKKYGRSKAEFARILQKHLAELSSSSVKTVLKEIE